MSTMTLAETIDLFVTANDENLNIPSQVLRWLRDYAAHLREREAAKLDPVAWRYRLDGDMQWQHTADKRICMGEIQPLYTDPMLASAQVPDGWQLVPVEPTREMQDKFLHALSWTRSPKAQFLNDDVRHLYQVMLAAAPKRGEG